MSFDSGNFWTKILRETNPREFPIPARYELVSRSWCNREFSIPKGFPTISRHFNAGLRIQNKISPEGTVENASRDDRGKFIGNFSNPSWRKVMKCNETFSRIDFSCPFGTHISLRKTRRSNAGLLSDVPTERRSDFKP